MPLQNALACLLTGVKNKYCYWIENVVKQITGLPALYRG
jgi:hypothetical protein